MGDLIEKDLMLKLSKRALATAGVLTLIIGAIAYSFRRPLGYFALYHLGRSPACTWEDFKRSRDHKPSQTQKRIEAHLATSSHKVREDPEGYELWDTPKGDFWIPSENGRMLLWLLATAERQIYQHPVCQVSPGDIVLDCGAHIGVFTKQFLSLGAKCIVAIEPSPENLKCLKRNLAEEIQAGHVIVCPKGVSDKEDILSFKIRPKSSMGNRILRVEEEHTAVQQIAVTTIDRLVAELDLERVDFIKMNIEGSEHQAITGANETISKFRPKLAIAAHHRDDDAERIPELVRAAWPGYQMRCAGCYLHRGRFLILPDILFFFE
jgi:FkbM family methyltransferase